MCFFFQAEDGIRDAQESRGLGDVYKRQVDGREVDLLIETEKGYIAIEIKMSGRIERTDARLSLIHI